MAGRKFDSQSNRPIMRLLEVVGQRWTLRIMWELREARLNFRALQAACGVSPSVLNARLKDLREHKIVDLTDEGYGLTEAGRALAQHLIGMTVWAEEWLD